MYSKRNDMDRKILKLLYRSFDDELTEKERARLEKAVKESDDLRKEKDRILAQREALAESAAPSFSPLFPERVMCRIESLDQKKNGFESFYETLLVVFRRFAIVGAAILLLLLIYNLQSGDILSSDEIYYASDLTFEEILDLPLF
jgi:anti-sigma factor RsiW